MIFCETVVLPLALPPQIPITKGFWPSTCWPWVLYHGGLPAKRNIHQSHESCRNSHELNFFSRRLVKIKNKTDLTSCVNCSVIRDPDYCLVWTNRVLACWCCSLAPRPISTWCRSGAKSRNCRRRGRQCTVLAFESAIVRVDRTGLRFLTFIYITKYGDREVLILLLRRKAARRRQGQWNGQGRCF